MLAERHWPVTIECTAGVHTNGKRLQGSILSPAHSKEITNRHFHGWRSFIVPVEAKNAVTPVARRRKPYMCDVGRAIHVRYCKCSFSFYPDAGAYLPALSKV